MAKVKIFYCGEASLESVEEEINQFLNAIKNKKPSAKVLSITQHFSEIVGSVFSILYEMESKND